jgi:asparaginyl-tRNA synthetase
LGRQDNTLLERLERVTREPFARVSYRDAITMLQEEISKDPTTWVYPEVEFGTDLATEHEKWLAEDKFNSCIFM